MTQMTRFTEEQAGTMDASRYRAMVLAGLVWLLLWTLLPVWVALQEPSLGWRFVPDPQGEGVLAYSPQRAVKIASREQAERGRPYRVIRPEGRSAGGIVNDSGGKRFLSFRPTSPTVGRNSARTWRGHLMKPLQDHSLRLSKSVGQRSPHILPPSLRHSKCSSILLKKRTIGHDPPTAQECEFTRRSTAKLRTMFYTYLDDLISSQKQDIASHVDGAQESLVAARGRRALRPPRARGGVFRVLLRLGPGSQ